MPGRLEAWVAIALLLANLPARAEAQPGDPRIEQAEAARRSGAFEEAIALLEAADSDRPDDPTILRLLGSSYAAAARYGNAIATLERARALAPGDQDIALALGRVLAWSGRTYEAKTVADRIATTDPGNPELGALRETIARSGTNSPTRRAGIAVTQILSRVSIRNETPIWRKTIVAVDVPLGERSTFVGTVDHESRAGPADTQLGLRFDHRLAAGSGVHLDVAATPDSSFRSDWSVGAGGEVRIARIVAISLDLRHAEFGRTNVTVAQPGLRLQTSDGRLGFSLASINLWGEGNVHQSGWSLRGDVALADGWLLTGGAATYPDTEEGITRQVHGFFLGIALPLSARLTLRATADHERREQSYRRDGIALSLGWRLGP